MTIHVTIGDAKTRLSELVAAAVRGEEVVIAKAGLAQVQLVPAAQASDRERISKQRQSAIGMFREAFDGFDTSLAALKADRPDPDERFGRKFGPAD